MRLHQKSREIPGRNKDSPNFRLGRNSRLRPEYLPLTDTFRETNTQTHKEAVQIQSRPYSYIHKLRRTHTHTHTHRHRHRHTDSPNTHMHTQVERDGIIHFHEDHFLGRKMTFLSTVAVFSEYLRLYCNFTLCSLQQTSCINNNSLFTSPHLQR